MTQEIFDIGRNKKLKANCFNVEKLESVLKGEADDALKVILKKAIKTGDSVYVWIDPYYSEMSNTSYIRGGIDKEVETNAYYLAQEEI